MRNKAEGRAPGRRRMPCHLDGFTGDCRLPSAVAAGARPSVVCLSDHPRGNDDVLRGALALWSAQGCKASRAAEQLYPPQPLQEWRE